MDTKYRVLLANAVRKNIIALGKKQTIRALKLYISQNNVNGFVENDNVKIMIEQIPNYEISRLIGSDVEKYIDGFFIIEEPKYENVEFSDEEIAQVIISSLKTTLNKLKNERSDLSYDQLYACARHYIDRIGHKDFKSITRDNNQRERLKVVLTNKSYIDFNSIVAKYLDSQGIEFVQLTEIYDNLANIVLNNSEDKSNILKKN